MEDRELQIIPHFYTKTWKNWLSNLRYSTLSTCVCVCVRLILK